MSTVALFRISPFDTGVGDDAEQLRSLEEEAKPYSTQDRLEALRQLLRLITETDLGLATYRAAVYANDLIQRLPSWAPNPEVSIDPDGEISLEWDSGRRCVFSVSVGPNGSLSFAGLFGEAIRHGVQTFSGEIPTVLLRGIERTIKGQPARY